MEKITLLINAPKDFEAKNFRHKLNQLKASDQTEVLLILYQNRIQNTIEDFPVFAVEEQDDVSFSQLLSAISTDKFLFFDPQIDYPIDFFTQILGGEEKEIGREKGSVWMESIIAIQQSRYGLCGIRLKRTDDVGFLKEFVLYEKKEVETLNTNKLSVHSESAQELYRYAMKKSLNVTEYKPKKEKVEYLTRFTDLMFACQKQAQKKFMLFPALFVLFFIVFGIGASFSPVFMLIFLIGMGAYLMAITLESFGISDSKKNGALLLVLLLLFPFVHLVYGLESWIARFKRKA